MTESKIDPGKIRVKDLEEALKDPEVWEAFVERYRAPILEVALKIGKVIYHVDQAIQAAAPKIAEFISKFSNIDWEALQRRNEALPEDTRSLMEAAAKKGWFVGWYSDLEEAFKLADQMNALDETQIDAYMASYYRKRFAQLAKNLTESYPKRARAIGAACRAHTHGSEDDYALTVPVFIAQGDGILAELCGTKMPLGKTKDKKKPKPGEVALVAQPGQTTATTLVLERVKREDDLKILAPMLILHTLQFLGGGSPGETEADTQMVVAELNRHEVMHGIVSDYGDETNSLKAFSFLCFVGLHVANYLQPPSQ